MPILRAYGGRPSTRRSPNRMSPPSTEEKPAIMRSSVVLPQPDGPSSVNSSPSPTSSETRSTAMAAPNRLVTSRSAILIRSRFLPDRFDVAAEPRLERLRALGGHGLVVDVRHVAVEVRAEAAGELHRHLRRRARRALHLVPRRDREQAALHENLLAALGQEKLDERARRLWITRAGEDGHRLRRDEGVLRRHELQLEAGELFLEGHIRWHREPGRIFSLATTVGTSRLRAVKWPVLAASFLSQSQPFSSPYIDRITSYVAFDDDERVGAHCATSPLSLGSSRSSHSFGSAMPRRWIFLG